MSLIRWIPVQQDLPSPQLSDPAGELCGLLASHPCLTRLGRGATAAVTVGSRGIPGIGILVARLVSSLKTLGIAPCIVPAMGSHGGASPEEQEEVLRHLGISEELVGAPVVSRAEVVDIGPTSSGLPVWVDAAAWQADAVIPVNRVKPHTAFRGPVESGPSKLLSVGLGKARSAEALHRAGLREGIPEVTQFLLASGKVPFGVAVVENPAGAVARLAVLEPGTWLETETALLAYAWTLHPSLPWRELDLLVVEHLGKDVSGTGMDLNVIGLGRRFPDSGAWPRISQVVALGLTPGSRGNATGLGYADVVTRGLFDSVDWEATRANCRTSGFLEAARCPPVAADEPAALAAAMKALGSPPVEAVRAVRITDTSHLANFLVSPALAKELPSGVHRS